MTDIVLNPITSGYNVSRINSNFEKIEGVINGEVLHTVGGNNTMQQNLDMNGYALLNIETDPNNPDSLLTVQDGDARYYNVEGDSLQGPFNANGQVMQGLRAPAGPTEAVRKQEFDQEVAQRISSDSQIVEGYTSADANLQAQISGGAPLEASAFSPISWHDQSIDNSVVIPENKNAWSFGPIMTITPGQVVTIGDGSFWTIANGEVQL